jgi:drug/metabolite transporter (DMT)-like permease
MTKIDAGAAVRSDSFLILVLTVIDSLHFIFARLLLPHAPPCVSAMFVMSVGTLGVGVFALFRSQLRFRVLAEHLRFFLAVGFLVAASTVINYEAIAVIGPGTASLLSRASIIFGLFFGLFWLRERLTRRQITGAALAVGGMLLISFQPGDYLRSGSLLILVSTFLYALHAALVKRYGGKMSFLDFFFFRLLVTSGFLFLNAWGSGELFWPESSLWGLLILVGTVDVIVSRSLYYFALRRLSMSFHSIVLTLSPAAAVLWSLLLFDVVPNVSELQGGAAVLVGVLLATRRPVVSGS